MPSPDAILFPDSLKRGKSSLDRTAFIQKALGPILGGKDHTSLGPQFGGRVYSRDVGGGMYLATLSAADTLLFPTDHDYARQPRYRWEDQTDGTKHGFLMTHEESEGVMAAETPAEREARYAALDAWKKRVEASDAKNARWKELVALGEKRTAEQTAELKALRQDPTTAERIASGLIADPFATTEKGQP